MIENGFVHLPERAPWLAIPRRADRLPQRQARRPGPPGHFVPGATAQLLDWFKGAAREPGGFYGYYRTLAEELHDPQTAKPVPLSASGLRRY
jgi:hypothetical protein